MSEIIKRYILEIKFKPNPAIVDIRGSLVSKYSTILKMPHWSFNNDRVDFFNDVKTIIFFISCATIGVYMDNPPTENYFLDKSVAFLKSVFDEKFMKDNTIVERFGLRTISTIPFDGEFSQLKDIYLKKYINITPGLQNILKDEVYDIGCPIILESQYGKYNISCGPMKKEQLISRLYNEVINNKIEIDKRTPEVGIYVDIDYWNTPKDVLKTPEVINLIHKFSDSNNERTNGIAKLLLGESYGK